MIASVKSTRLADETKLVARYRMGTSRWTTCNHDSRCTEGSGCQRLPPVKNANLAEMGTPSVGQVTASRTAVPATTVARYAGSIDLRPIARATSEATMRIGSISY